MDVADLIISEHRLSFSADPSARPALPGEGLTHWSCTFRGEDDSFVVPLSTEGDSEPGAALVLGLLAADMRDVGDGRDVDGLARLWGIDVAAARESVDRHMRLVAAAEAVIGEGALLALASGTTQVHSAADAMLLSI